MTITQQHISAACREWDEYVESMGSVMGGVERMAQEMRDMLEQLAAENARLRDALFECQEEIDAYIQHEYPHDHPVQERYRQRDYAANPARIALQDKPHDTTT